MSKAHPHAELIKEWAQDCTRQFQYKNPEGAWRDCPGAPAWLTDVEYRAKPEVVYPESLLADGDMVMLARGVHPMANAASGYRAIANAAIRHAIDSGQVVVPGEVVENPHPGGVVPAVKINGQLVGKRDLAIAEAVMSSILALESPSFAQYMGISSKALRKINLADIIATVKA